PDTPWAADRVVVHDGDARRLMVEDPTREGPPTSGTVYLSGARVGEVLPQRAPAGWSVVRVHPDAVAPLVEGRRTTSFERGPHFEGRNLDLAGLPARDRGHRGYVDVWTVDGPAPTRLVRGYSDGERVRVPPEEVDAVRAALDGQTARLVRVFPGTEQVWWLALQAPVPPGASEVSVGVADVEVVRGRIVDGGMLRVVDPTVIGALLRADSRGLLTLRRL
ncbi:MAG: hypothetical protein KC656_05445, partial [Myxococcales bacterium]|nr:hypothetical protein [Myxococcales bacterium]